MRRVYKYPLEVVDRQTIEHPRGARLLCVQMQGDGPCLWALVNPDNPPVETTFRIVGTGHPIEDADDLGYVGTFQMMGGGLVFHVFKERIYDEPNAIAVPSSA